MIDTELKDVADSADFIINGYAFTLCDGNVRVLNLHRPDHATELLGSHLGVF